MTLYEKVGTGKGTRYRPVRETDEWGSLPAGFHLLHVRPGLRSLIYNVNPDTATLLAASRHALDAMKDAIVEAGKFRPTKAPITPKQRAAWEAFAEAMGTDLLLIQAGSAQSIAEAGVQALIDATKEKP